MSDIKLPRPIEDYLIGKYDSGACCYLITKEAYKTWFNQRVPVKHLCIKNNDGLSMVQYPLSGNDKYQAYKYNSDVPEDWKRLVYNESPSLYKQFFESDAKSESTPDQFYILYRKEDGNYFTVKRKDLSSDSFDGPMWKSSSASWIHSSKYVTGSEITAGTWYKKFPQLSSEIKAELQKLNPKRYREWEQFYMNKYPGFQPLKIPGIRLSIDSINLLAFIAIQPPYDALYKDYKFKGAGWGLISKDSWVDGDKDVEFTHWKSGDIYWVDRKHLGSGLTNWESLGDNHHKYLIESNSLTYNKFKQYYSTLEPQKSVAKQYSKYGEYYEVPIDDFEILSYNNNSPYLLLKSDKAKLGDTENCIGIDLQTLTPDWKSPYLAKPYSYKPSQRYLYIHEKLYNLPHIHSELIKIWNNSPGLESWNSKVRSYPKATFNKIYEAFKDTASSTDYNKIKQPYYTPNLKQQNNAINVSTKTITVIRGQSLSRNSVQSQRSQPSVAAGYTKYRPGIIHCQKKPGGCQIGTSL